MSKKKKSDDDAGQASFEQALEQLQAIVRELESGQLTLDQSLAKYEQGVTNLRLCYDLLQRAEQKIRMLVDVDEQGQMRSKPFAHSATVGETTSDRQRKPKQPAVADDDHDEPGDSDDDFGDDDDDSDDSDHHQKLF